MNWCLLLAAASLACPWSRNTVRTYYWCEPTPVYVTCQPTPCYVYPSTMVCGPEVAGVVAEAKAVEDPALAKASAEEAEESDLEFVNFSAPAPYTGGDLALDWGVASIGAGTLYPNQPYVNAGAGGFFGGRGGGGNGDSFLPGVSYTIINNTIINNIINNGGGPGPDPIPEPAAVAVWLFGGSAALYWLHRRRSAGRAGATRAS